MTEYKEINQKEIWILLKVYFGGRVEFTDAFWKEEDARKAAAKQIPVAGDTFTLSLHTATLHGFMLDIK
jgi:hypothetical protein